MEQIPLTQDQDSPIPKIAKCAAFSKSKVKSFETPLQHDAKSEETSQIKRLSLGCIKSSVYHPSKRIGDKNYVDRISKSMILIRHSSVGECVSPKTFGSLENIMINREEPCSDDANKRQDGAEDFQDQDASGGKKHKRLCSIIDGFISCFIVGPLVVASWRGIWNAMDLHSKIFPEYTTACCGLVVHMIFVYLRDHFQKCEAAKKSGYGLVFRRIFSRLYCWIFLVCCVSHWRGGWAAWPSVQEEGIRTIVRMIACLVLLIILRATRNLLTAPFFVQMDSLGSTYSFPTRYNKSSREPLLYLLDCLFSVVVVGSLVVFVWRGAWDLLDVYLFPQDKALSAWTSFLLGYGLAIVTFLLQSAARRACTKLQGAQRLIVADLFLLISFVSTINVWRSIWSLLDIYFIPESPELSNWLTHGVSFVLLMLLNCANSVIVRGVYIDAEEEGGQCVVFPCYYLRLFFQKERLKKRKQLLDLAAAKVEQDPTGAQPLIAPIKATIPANHAVVHLSTHNECTAEKNNGNTPEPT